MNSKLNFSENIFQPNPFSHFTIVMHCVYVSVLVYLDCLYYCFSVEEYKINLSDFHKKKVHSHTEFWKVSYYNPGYFFSKCPYV